MILTSIYRDWELDEDDRRVIETLGLEGVEGICAVHVALGQVFAHNPQLAALWPTTPNRVLNNKTPMDVVREEGMDGLRRVRALLEPSAFA
jgi:hypothetical protein